MKSIHDVVRVKEPYTGKPAYDTLPRSSLIDRFLDSGVTLEEFENNEFQECGDFSGSPYELSSVAGGKKLDILLKRTGEVSSGPGSASITLEKRITLAVNSGVLEIEYKFTNSGSTIMEAVFGSEWNINLLGGGHNESAYYRVAGRELEDERLDSRGEIDGVQQLSLGNTYLDIEMELRLDRPLKIWRFPVESISNSEGGVEQVYQCSCVVILLPLKIGPGESAVFKYSWHVWK